MQASHIKNSRLTTPNSVLMVRPCAFRPNEQTAKTIVFRSPLYRREKIERKYQKMRVRNLMRWFALYV